MVCVIAVASSAVVTRSLLCATTTRTLRIAFRPSIYSSVATARQEELEGKRCFTKLFYFSVNRTTSKRCEATQIAFFRLFARLQKSRIRQARLTSQLLYADYRRAYSYAVKMKIRIRKLCSNYCLLKYVLDNLLTIINLVTNLVFFYNVINSCSNRCKI